jgi:hypothetical protein
VLFSEPEYELLGDYQEESQEEHNWNVQLARRKIDQFVVEMALMVIRTILDPKSRKVAGKPVSSVADGVVYCNGAVVVNQNFCAMSRPEYGHMQISRESLLIALQKVFAPPNWVVEVGNTECGWAYPSTWIKVVITTQDFGSLVSAGRDFLRDASSTKPIVTVPVSIKTALTLNEALAELLFNKEVSEVDKDTLPPFNRTDSSEVIEPVFFPLERMVDSKGLVAEYDHLGLIPLHPIELCRVIKLNPGLASKDQCYTLWCVEGGWHYMVVSENKYGERWFRIEPLEEDCWRPEWKLWFAGKKK